jgi:hypothetical protein
LTDPGIAVVSGTVHAAAGSTNETRGGMRTTRNILAVLACGLSFGAALSARLAYADVNIVGDWAGKGKCQILDSFNTNAPLKLSEDVQVTFYSDGQATSGSEIGIHGHFASLDFGTFYLEGALLASTPANADEFVVYYQADPPGCSIPGPQEVLYGTIKKGKIKAIYITSTSRIKFGSCKLSLKQTSTTASSSPCP